MRVDRAWCLVWLAAVALWTVAVYAMPLPYPFWSGMLGAIILGGIIDPFERTPAHIPCGTWWRYPGDGDDLHTCALAAGHDGACHCDCGDVCGVRYK